MSSNQPTTCGKQVQSNKKNALIGVFGGPSLVTGAPVTKAWPDLFATFGKEGNVGVFGSNLGLCFALRF